MSFNLFHSPAKIDFVSTKNPDYIKESKKYDDVDNPKHYIEGRKFEPAWVINDWNLDWDIGTCVKYLSRLGRKDVKSKDIKKAFWYIVHEIALKHKDIQPEELISTINNIYSKESKYGKTKNN